MAQETKPYWGDKHRPFVKIGTDEEELRALADAVVRGASIAHAEIADLRALIKAVQSHSSVKFPPSKDDVRVDADQDASTSLVIHGGRIESCDCSGLDIRLRLAASANFPADASFRGASFWSGADFGHAKFSGDANFGLVSFSCGAGFGVATFSGEASFWHANFSGDASFGEASFSGLAYFAAASFSGGADFLDANFSGDANFGDASFWHANFRVASFSGDVDFTRTSFVGDVSLDARWIDVRTIRFGRFAEFADSGRRGAIKRWMRRRFGWTVVRGIGELGILTRVSLIALIAVPILAGLWPALRVAVNRYNRAMTEASEQFDQAADRLETAAETTAPALSVTIGEFATWADDWRDRFGEMTMDQPQLSWTLALAFFAAVGVTIGQLLYQINAPVKLRKEDEDEFVEGIHKRYREGAPDRNDGLRRATDALAAVARIRGDRHANFVDHHGETVWIPPGTRIDWFSDLKDEDDSDNGQVDADDPAGVQDPLDPKKGRAAGAEGIIPGAERGRIALEEGARAEYWLTGREKPFWAWMSFVFYCVAVLLLFWILIIQSQHVAKAAGWW